MSADLDSFFKACDRHRFVYDHLDDAYKAGVLMLKGSSSLNRICIVPHSHDAPDEVLSPMDDLLVIRARDIVSGQWFLLTRDDGSTVPVSG